MIATIQAARRLPASRVSASAPATPWRLPFTVALAIAVLAILLLASLPALARPALASGLAQPHPQAAPAPTSAFFPDQSNIASCAVLADRSNALDAPRSQQSASIVGPLYAEACLAG